MRFRFDSFNSEFPNTRSQQKRPQTPSFAFSERQEAAGNRRSHQDRRQDPAVSCGLAMSFRRGGSDAQRPFDRGINNGASNRGRGQESSYLSNRGGRGDQFRHDQRQNGGGNGYGHGHTNRNCPPSSVRGLSHSPVRDRSQSSNNLGPPRASHPHHRLDPSNGANLGWRTTSRRPNYASNQQRPPPLLNNVPASSFSRGTVRPQQQVDHRRQQVQQQQVQQQQQQQQRQRQQSSITPPPVTSSRVNSNGGAASQFAPGLSSSRGIDGQQMGYSSVTAGPVVPGPRIYMDLPPQLQVPQNIVRLINWKDRNLLDVIWKVRQ